MIDMEISKKNLKIKKNQVFLCVITLVAHTYSYKIIIEVCANF